MPHFRITAPLALYLMLSARSLGASVPGRDFWPGDLATTDFIAPPTEGVATWFASDSYLEEDRVLVYIFQQNQIFLGSYDLNSGDLDIDTEAPLLSPSGTADTPDQHAITNVAVQPCHPRVREDVALEWDATEEVCRFPDLGVDPTTIDVRRVEQKSAGCGCAGAEEVSNTWRFVVGYDDGVTATTDGIELADTTSQCADLTASYEYTDCSLGEDAWRCPVGGAESGILGACSYFMMFESEAGGEQTEDSPAHRIISLAHAPRPSGPWLKWIEEGRTEMSPKDIRVMFTGPHIPEDESGRLSFASVPDVWFDPNDGVWRMWFTGEAGSGSAMWYTDSPDDGLSWGITRYERKIDCWDKEALDYDYDLCARVEWELDAVPPDDPETSRNPDAVDFAVYDYPGGAAGNVAVMFTAANSNCDGQPREGAFLFGTHPDGGDQSTGVPYKWERSVQLDTETGIVIAADRSGNCDVVLHDFNITKVEDDQYVMFFTQVPPDGIHVAGSGFGCADFTDNDEDGLTDYGFDPDCASPTDDSE